VLLDSCGIKRFLSTCFISLACTCQPAKWPTSHMPPQSICLAFPLSAFLVVCLSIHHLYRAPPTAHCLFPFLPTIPFRQPIPTFSCICERRIGLLIWLKYRGRLVSFLGIHKLEKVHHVCLLACLSACKAYKLSHVNGQLSVHHFH
jgi:hypothetical protein